MIKFWIIPPLILVAAFFASGIISALLTQLAIKSGPVDRPRKRGSHHTPTPTSGGLAVIAATALSVGLCGLLLKNHLYPDGGHGLSLFIYAALMGLSGAVDDVLGLPAKFKLAFQVLLSIGFACLYPVTHLNFGFGVVLNLWTGLAITGTAFWLVLGLNTINFMDGSNGLAIGSQAIALSIMSAMIIILGPLSDQSFHTAGLLLICIAALGAYLGFLPFNLPMGKIFQGDAGSLFGGALITGGILLMINGGVTSLWLGGYVLAPLLVDVVLTLILRARNKERLFEAHKQHLYQQWLLHKDPSHLHMALRVWGLCAFAGGFGLLMRFIHITVGLNLRFTGLVFIMTLYSVGWLWLRSKLNVESVAKSV